MISIWYHNCLADICRSGSIDSCICDTSNIQSSCILKNLNILLLLDFQWMGVVRYLGCTVSPILSV